MAFYGTLTAANTYHRERKNTTWSDSFDNSAKNAALLRAAEYLDAAYRAQFPGYKKGLRDQVREWPRVGAYDVNGQTITDSTIPQEVIDAGYEAALREFSTPGSLNPDYDPTQQVRSEKVGPIAVEYTASHGPNSVRPIIPVIGAIIAPVLTGAASSPIAGHTARI